MELQERLNQLIKANPDGKLRDLVRELLYTDIISLHIAPGSKLNVNQLASALGISRTPVAEAVASLAEIGFVVSRPGQSGSYVLDLSLVDMINLYHVRSAIESEAAALCAHAASDDMVRELTLLADVFKDSVLKRDIQGMKDTDTPFHRLIVENCGNPYIVQAYSTILPKLTMYQSSMLEFIALDEKSDNPWLSSVIYNHTSVASAIRLRLPDVARSAMAEHVTSSLNFTSVTGHMPDPFQLLHSRK